MSNSRLLPAALPLVLVASCSTPQISQEQYLHSLTIEKSGGPMPVEVEQGPLQLNPSPDNTIATQLSHIETAFRDKDRILLFVHGGLNTLEDGLARTSKVAECVVSDSGTATYPLFVNWNSDLLSSYWAHLMHYRQGKRVQDFWGAMSSPFYLLADVGRAVVRMPIVIWYQGYEAACRLTLSTQVQAVPASWRERVQLVDQYEQPVGERIVDGITQFVPGVVRVLTTPLTDTLGFAGYDMIQRRIDTLFRTESDIRGRTNQPSGAVSQLMATIPKDMPIVLIGHSMGTIVINELVRRFPEHNYETIVFQGAACTIHDFANAIPGYMREHRTTRFYNLCLHPAAEVNEVNGWSLIPNGSLLEWLDAFVLGPRTSFDRTMGKWNNVVYALGMLGDLPQHVQERIFIKGFPVRDGKFPDRHGSFNDFAFWREAFWDPRQVAPVPTIDEVHADHRHDSQAP
jgi:pimeloyl-ACP methyl ester carboxylesterase